MKRDPRLRDLSEDHHHALVLARRATRAAAGGQVSNEEWEAMVRSFEAELEPHFVLEERYLLPVLENGPHAHLVERTLREHAALRELIRGEEGPLDRRLGSFGAALSDHVRFEERELFQIFQDEASAQALEAIADACRRARDGGGPV